MRIIVLLAVLGLALCSVEQTAHGTAPQQVSEMFETSTEPEIFSMSAEEWDANMQPLSGQFTHARELLSAVDEGKDTFEAMEFFDHKAAEEEWKMDPASFTFQDSLNKGYYNTITKYTLLPGTSYVNYDSARHHSASSYVVE